MTPVAMTTTIFPRNKTNDPMELMAATRSALEAFLEESIFPLTDIYKQFIAKKLCLTVFSVCFMGNQAESLIIMNVKKLMMNLVQTNC